MIYTFQDYQKNWFFDCCGWWMKRSENTECQPLIKHCNNHWMVIFNILICKILIYYFLTVTKVSLTLLFSIKTFLRKKDYLGLLSCSLSCALRQWLSELLAGYRCKQTSFAEPLCWITCYPVHIYILRVKTANSIFVSHATLMNIWLSSRPIIRIPLSL